MDVETKLILTAIGHRLLDLYIKLGEVLGTANADRACVDALLTDLHNGATSAAELLSEIKKLEA